MTRMNTKPTRNFIIIWTLLIALFVGGLITAFILSQRICCALPPGPTATFLVTTVGQTEAAALQQTSAAELTSTQLNVASATVQAIIPSFTPTRTPIPYDASMSPTAPISSDQATRWAMTMTANALMASPTPTPAPAVHDSNCVFNWARQDLPELTTLAQAALDEAEISFVRVWAEAYGENCYRSDQTISYFAAMTTDFYLTIPLENLDDKDLMGKLVAATYRMLSAIPKESMPASLGYLDITFIKGQETEHFRAMFPTLKPRIEAGETGAVLLAAGT